MKKNVIPFNQPYMTGNELDFIADAHSGGRLSGDGPYTKRCEKWLEKQTGCSSALLTHSCTGALEMSALLLDIHPGDEIIMPSYTFVSTANAFVLRGGVPVFVDIREDTLNIDERLIEDAITEKTKAIVPVHYAGVSCEMDSILNIARTHSLSVIEDAAQGILSTYKGKPLGSIGNLGAYSFHETKNVISGEGGALLINDANLALQAEIIREKGTNRTQFFKGAVDKYTWQDVGSSFLPGELTAAFLCAQLEEAEQITNRRLEIWQRYHHLLEPLEHDGRLIRQTVPKNCKHNGHMYYILLPPEVNRKQVLASLNNEGINAVFHYVPLHSSPAGSKLCRTHGSLEVTNTLSECLIRLPFWIGLSADQQERVVNTLNKILECASV